MRKGYVFGIIAVGITITLGMTSPVMAELMEIIAFRLWVIGLLVFLWRRFYRWIMLLPEGSPVDSASQITGKGYVPPTGKVTFMIAYFLGSSVVLVFVRGYILLTK